MAAKRWVSLRSTDPKAASDATLISWQSHMPHRRRGAAGRLRAQFGCACAWSYANSILRADHIAIGVAVATVVRTTIVAVAVVVVAVSGGTGCGGSYCCGTDRRSAIRITPAPSSAT